MTPAENRSAVFHVLDAMDHPHGGRILRLRLDRGDAPSLRELREATLVAVSGEGERRELEVGGFADLGGKASDERLARTGRVDVHALDSDGKDGPPVDLKWEVRLRYDG
ncbi:MAG: hypothetical protein GWM92_14550 [Gemmatimonadetes bacterium]|nr:hypothetical protein [Gemmatimonadota bacterium]NIR79961.1 hypothetical protein [Gemmatimonadota bacterium]NIT88686.1 hypothetical protein [Gemmatimonadota bacterium]NIU32497.1 hypothetical protein [Gemmatimonadota bacterium]NIU36976.1 hypothetical protein [Gemmatimonadota bacterium]